VQTVRLRIEHRTASDLRFIWWGGRVAVFNASTGIAVAGLHDLRAGLGLIVAPGGLVDQWQDELFFKFG
jgi:hypothetical protein